MDEKYEVAVVAADSYEQDNLRDVLSEAIDAVGGFDFLKAGMTVAIKANLVSFMPPDAAATTHPALLSELVRMLRERGAKVILGDSPGGVYSAPYVNRVYKVTGMGDVEEAGAELNRDFSVLEAAFPEGKVLHSFTYTSYLDKADVIINFCKLKSHGMMEMSAAAKNLFGVIPGIVKPEYHYRFPNHADFARMIVDLNDYFKPVLSLCDAIVGMEGNGPTQGTPRKIGAVLASKSPHKLDMIAADLIGLDPLTVPTLTAAHERGYIPDSIREIKVYGDPGAFRVPDFKNIPSKSSIEFGKDSEKFFGKTVRFLSAKLLRSRPALTGKNQCVGCGVCANICPAKAITIEKGKAKIDRLLCIRCFCCQEFCPKGAMGVHHPLAARLLSGKKK